jgi:hypothetical protein
MDPRDFRQTPKLLKYLVDLIGIEPMTSSMPWKRAPSCATGPLFYRTTLFLQNDSSYSLGVQLFRQTAPAHFRFAQCNPGTRF